MRERLAHWNAASAELDGSLLARGDCVLKIKLSWKKSASGKATFGTQAISLQTDLYAVRAVITATHLLAAEANYKPDQLCADSSHLTSHVLDLTFTANSLRLQFSNSQASTYCAAASPICSERGYYLSFLRSPVGQIVRLESGFDTLATQALDSCSSLCRGAGSFLVDFWLLWMKTVSLRLLLNPALVSSLQSSRSSIFITFYESFSLPFKRLRVTVDFFHRFAGPCNPT